MEEVGKRINIAQQDTCEEILNCVKPSSYFGFIEHTGIKSPSQRIEYIGRNTNYTPVKVTMGGGFNLNGWADFPVLLANKPYMVRADGTPDYRLNENDYTKKEDGSASDIANTSYNGGAFSWLAKIYKKEYMAGQDRCVLFSMTKAPGFEAVGFTDETGAELEGMWIPMFYGSVLDADKEKPKMVSLSGLQPGYKRNTDQEHTAITNFSPRGSFLGGPIVETITDLLMMFAKTSDIQEAYGYGNCGGYDASLAPTYGVKQNAVISGGQFYGTNDNKSLNKILHSVVLGSWQQWQRDPYEVVVNGHVKVSKNYKYDPTGATYTDTGIVVPDNMTWDDNQNALDCPAEYRAVQGYGSIPAGTMKDGTSSTGGCDGLWRKDPKQAFVAVCLRFGCCADRGSGGPRARSWNIAAGDAWWGYGASVLLKPPVGVAV